jgi:hypothetical protein
VQRQGQGSVKLNSTYAGIVVSVGSGDDGDDVYCMVALSPFVIGKLYYMDISSDIELVKSFKEKCFVGLRVIVAVVSIKSDDGYAYVFSRAVVESEINATNTTPLNQIFAKSSCSDDVDGNLPVVGSLVHGIIDLKSKFVPRMPAVLVSLAGGNALVGRVCATEIADSSDWRDLAELMSNSAQGKSVFTSFYY